MSTVQSHFRLWRQAIQAAGLTAGPKSRRYSDEECYENLLCVWTHLGRPPKYREMKEPPSKVGGKAYVIRWRTWVRALEAFASRVDQDTAPHQAVGIADDGAAEFPRRGKLEEDDGRIRLGIRYRTLVRDNFKCVICGDSPATNPLCKLHVDHVHPHSKGGRTTPENLRTLCSKCNVGKSNLTIEGEGRNP